MGRLGLERGGTTCGGGGGGGGFFTAVTLEIVFEGAGASIEMSGIGINSGGGASNFGGGGGNSFDSVAISSINLVSMGPVIVSSTEPAKPDFSA